QCTVHLPATTSSEHDQLGLYLERTGSQSLLAGGEPVEDRPNLLASELVDQRGVRLLILQTASRLLEPSRPAFARQALSLQQSRHCLRPLLLGEVDLYQKVEPDLPAVGNWALHPVEEYLLSRFSKMKYLARRAGFLRLQHGFYVAFFFQSGQEGVKPALFHDPHQAEAIRV